MIGSGILGNKTAGEAIVDGMNLMGYDAMALGPKELSLGLGLLRNRAQMAKYPMLSANVVVSGSQDLIAPAYAVLEMEGHRVGIIGLTRIPEEPVPEFAILDPQQALLRHLPEVASQADTIILLTNLDFRAAQALAAETAEIDLIIAALPQQLPRQVMKDPQSGTLLVTAEQPVTRHSGRRIGALSLLVASDGKPDALSWESVAMDRQIPDDPQMAILLETYQR